MSSLVEAMNREKLVTGSFTSQLEAQNALDKIQAVGSKSGGARASVQEQHMQNVNQACAALRGLGQTITDISHTDKKKMPAGMTRSVIHHKSGAHKLKTVVKTKFNTEGRDHDKVFLTSADDGEKEKDKKEKE